MKKISIKTKTKAKPKTKIKSTAQKIDFTPFRDECKKIILRYALKKFPANNKGFKKLATDIVDFISSAGYFDFDDLINDIKKQFILKFQNYAQSIEYAVCINAKKPNSKLVLVELAENIELCILSNKMLLERVGLSSLHEYSSIMELKKYRTLIKAGVKRDKQYKVISAIINRKEKELADFPKQILETLKLALDNPVNIVNKQTIDTFKDTFLSDIDTVKEWLKKSK